MQESFFEEYKYIIVPFLVWFGIQLFKFIYDLVKSKKFNFKRLMQAGGMPSSHSGVVISLTTMIGKNVGINSPLFAVALIFSFIVMYDAAGVRRAAGKQAKLLNKIVYKLKEINVYLSKVCIYLIRFYQKYISPLKGPTCRFYPTCSEYCKMAIDKYGIIKGIFKIK